MKEKQTKHEKKKKIYAIKNHSMQENSDSKNKKVHIIIKSSLLKYVNCLVKGCLSAYQSIKANKCHPGPVSKCKKQIDHNT